MGRQEIVAGAVALPELLARLRAAGAPSTIVMVDGQLVMPNAAPATWSDVRIKTPAGTFALKRQADGAVAVVAFGNADAAAVAMQSQIAAALKP
jgi:hypothetical protein